MASAALIALSVWTLGYVLADSALPGLQHSVLFQSTASDVTFALCGLLLIMRRERGWALFGVGAVCWAAGDFYWSLALANLKSPPVPSPADAGYLLFCPLACAGIISLIRRRGQRVAGTLVADAAAAALAIGAISAAVVVKPVLSSAHGGTAAIATNLAYPLVDMLLLGLVVGAAALNGWRLDRTWALLGAAALAFWVADSLYLVTDAAGTYDKSAWFNPLWNVSPMLAAWAAWLPHPPLSRGSSPQLGARRIVMPLAFVCAALGILVWSSFSPRGVAAVALGGLSLIVIMVRLALTWRENAALLRASQAEALTDSLTQLGNRRALILDLERRIASPAESGRFVLALFDLDGFKYYNDTFGHLAGDALLRRLARNLEGQLGDRGRAFRMGGDEFCAIIEGTEAAGSCVAAMGRALSEQGEGFSIASSYGFLWLPDEAHDVSGALRLADQRMYTQKQSGHPSASRQSSAVLLSALSERDPRLGSHVRDVADLAVATAGRLGLSDEEVEQIRLAAELHDIGKMAIPDVILEKAGPLDESEWEFIRRHTVIGERILSAAPALRRVAMLVRLSHENVDGSGYPEGRRGEEIPVGARIVSVCDAFDAMTSDRSYRRAMSSEAAIAELRRCAGRQFDPEVVEQFCAVLSASEVQLVG